MHSYRKTLAHPSVPTKNGGKFIVQVFAGHRQPSSTEVYRATDLEELRAAVLKYHPPL